uniref:Uncharacterized protein n=1 Tax=Amazona collaria TaxID=241587 RepID=A0A8B9FUT7_9PSIT
GIRHPRTHVGSEHPRIPVGSEHPCTHVGSEHPRIPVGSEHHCGIRHPRIPVGSEHPHIPVGSEHPRIPVGSEHPHIPMGRVGMHPPIPAGHQGRAAMGRAPNGAPEQKGMKGRMKREATQAALLNSGHMDRGRIQTVTQRTGIKGGRNRRKRWRQIQALTASQWHWNPWD